MINKELQDQDRCIQSKDLEPL